VSTSEPSREDKPRKRSASRIALVLAFAFAFLALTAGGVGVFGAALLSGLAALVALILGPTRTRIWVLLPLLASTYMFTHPPSDARAMVELYMMKGNVHRAAEFGTAFAQALDRRWESTHSLPKSPAELSVPIPEQEVADVRIESREKFTVTVRMSQELQGVLVFRASRENGKYQWRCTAQGPATRFAPPNCRRESETPAGPEANAPAPR